jgi:transcriptional regulator GlxA family with amidase domain
VTLRDREDFATSDSTKPLVAIVAAPESSPSILYGLYDVLLAVGVVYPDMTMGEPGEAMLDVRIVNATGKPFRCFGNVMVEPHASVDDMPRADVVIVCDMYSPIDAALRGRYPREISWLRRMHDGGALVTAVCSGALVLAEAGLLDGRECATHWAYRDLIREEYPKVKFSRNAMMNRTHEAEGIITAGGVTAWQDLALYLIARLCGRDHAVRIAKVYLLEGHDDGQLPFAAMSRRIQKSDAVVARCQAWLADNYACANPVTTMAQQSGLTLRTFARRFRAATGYLPMDYVHDLRIEEARQIIETDACGLDDVGYAVGYEDPTFFRRLFKRKTGLTPAAYRRKFVGLLLTES